ncbi:streptophobe family protein [Streptomyces daliensis]
MRDPRAPAPARRALDVLLTAVASVTWSFAGMAGTAALGLHLLGADAAGSLGPLTAAAVALAVGGSVVPDGDVKVFGLKGADAEAALDVMPLGVALAGALLLAYFFLRSLRAVGHVVRLPELAARVASVAVLFLAVLGWLAWAGHSTVTLDGERLRQGAEDRLRAGMGDRLGGLEGLDGGIGDLGGGLMDGLGGLMDAKTSVGFAVETVPTLLAGACWVLGVLLTALAASRRTPLPPGRLCECVHRTVRPAASALVLVLLLTVTAGLAAAGYAAATGAGTGTGPGAGEGPGRIAGAALLGAPNGTWLAVPLGLLVTFRGAATGELAKLLPDPVDAFLAAGDSDGRSMTVADLAGLDSRVWLLTVAVGLALLAAGVLTGARTPRRERERGRGVLGFAVRCGVSLGAVTAVALPVLVLLTGVEANAGLSVMGFDAMGAGVELRGSVPGALVLGALWGAAAGFVGALMACATGAAGRRTSRFASEREGPEGSGAYDTSRTWPALAYERGPYRPTPQPGLGAGERNPYKEGPDAGDPYGQGPGSHGGGPRGGEGPARGGSPHSAQTIAGGPPHRPYRSPEPPPPGPPPPHPPPRGPRRGRRPGSGTEPDEDPGHDRG